MTSQFDRGFDSLSGLLNEQRCVVFDVGERSATVVQVVIDEKAINDFLRTVDGSGNLMPSFLFTTHSDKVIRRGWAVEIPEELFGKWIRLTAAGASQCLSRFERHIDLS